MAGQAVRVVRLARRYGPADVGADDPTRAARRAPRDVQNAEPA